MPNFLIADAYTTYNKGDASIVLSMLKNIRKLYPDSEISILTATPKEDSEYYSKYGAKTYPWLFNMVGKKRNKYVSMISLVLKMLTYLIWTKFNFIPISNHAKFTLNLYRNADLVITCGGGYLGGNKFFSIRHMFPVYIAKKFGKKIYVYAQSIEPFTSTIVKIFTKFVLSRVDLITVREQYSLELLKSINLGKITHLTADVAFLLDQESVECAKKLLEKHGIISNEAFRIGMTVRDWNFPTSVNPREKRIEYINAISSFVEKVLQERNTIVVFFPQVIFTAENDDDRIISNQIKCQIKESLQDRVFVLTENYLPQEIKAMIGTMDIFVGTRMHSNIFAISMNIPTLAIAYEYKTNGIMKMLGLDQYVLDISNVTEDMLMESVNKLLRERETIVQKIKERLPILQKEALRNGEFIKDILEKN